MSKKKTQLLAMDRREATLGTNISTNSELHGEERIPRKDIPITTMIDKRELCALLREPLASEALFNRDGKNFEPLFAGKFGAIPVVGKFENCSLRVYVGIDLNEIQMVDVVLSTIRIEPLVGGMTRMKFTAQYHPDATDSAIVSTLDNWLGQDVKIELVIGKVKTPDDKQAELPMDVEQPEHETEAA